MSSWRELSLLNKISNSFRRFTLRSFILINILRHFYLYIIIINCTICFITTSRQHCSLMAFCFHFGLCRPDLICSERCGFLPLSDLWFLEPIFNFKDRDHKNSIIQCFDFLGEGCGMLMYEHLDRLFLYRTGESLMVWFLCG